MSRMLLADRAGYLASAPRAPCMTWQLPLESGCLCGIALKSHYSNCISQSRSWRANRLHVTLLKPCMQQEGAPYRRQATSRHTLFENLGHDQYRRPLRHIISNMAANATGNLLHNGMGKIRFRCTIVNVCCEWPRRCRLGQFLGCPLLFAPTRHHSLWLNDLPYATSLASANSRQRHGRKC